MRDLLLQKSSWQLPTHHLTTLLLYNGSPTGAPDAELDFHTVIVSGDQAAPSDTSLEQVSLAPFWYAEEGHALSHTYAVPST